jgi:hypothetical protein
MSSTNKGDLARSSSTGSVHARSWSADRPI